MPKDKKSELDNICSKNKTIWRDSFKIMEKYDFKNAIKITDKELNDYETDNIENKPKIIKIFNEDLMTVTNAVCELGLRPLIVCESNENYPIEYVRSGGIGDECDLLRLSNLAICISETDYPIRDLNMLYTPLISIFKTWNNRRLTNVYKAAVLLITPVRRPILMSIKTEEGMMETYHNKIDGERMRQKIMNAFRVAHKYNHKTIVISGLGGKTENPITEIVKYFNEAIAKYPVKYIFLSIKSHENIFNNERRDKIFEYFHNNIVR